MGQALGLSLQYLKTLNLDDWLPRTLKLEDDF